MDERLKARMLSREADPSPKPSSLTLGIVLHTFSPSTWEAEAGGSLFKASLVYTVSSRPVKATYGRPCLKINKETRRRGLLGFAYLLSLSLARVSCC